MAYVLDQKKCSCCHRCRVECPVGAITFRNSKYWIDPDKCLGCGSCVKVQGLTGNKVRATWRTAAQRLEDARRDKHLIEVCVPGSFTAQPLDRVELTLPAMGVEGVFTVQTAESVCGDAGVSCTLTLRE